MTWAGICRMGGIGDNLITSSVIPLLKEKYGHVEVLSKAPGSCVFENNPHIDRLIIKEDDAFPKGGKEWQEWFYHRGKEYDFFAHLSHTCEHLIAFGAHQSEFWWPQEYRRELCDKSYLAIVHDVCRVPHTYNPRFFPTHEEKEKAKETKSKNVGKRCIGWVLSGTRIDKQHPYSPMIIARLLRETGLPVIMFGGPGKEFEMAKSVHEDVKKINSSDEGLHLALSPDHEKPSWPVRRVLSQIHECDIVVGPDTGPMWAAAMEPMPKVMLLSHASQKNITTGWYNTTTLHADPERVPCFPCHRLHDDYTTCTPNKDRTGAACITDISVEAVVSTVLELSKEG